MSALYAAAKSGCIKSIEKIEEASSESQETIGENIKRLYEPGFEGKNALHVAAANNHPSAFQKILSIVYGSVPTSSRQSFVFKDKFGRTPIHYAGKKPVMCLASLLNLFSSWEWNVRRIFGRSFRVGGRVVHRRRRQRQKQHFPLCRCSRLRRCFQKPLLENKKRFRG